MSHHDYAKTENTSGQKTLQSYVIGLILCILLTVMAFAMVKEKMFSNEYLYLFLAALAIIQLLVQSVFFLRLNNSAEGRWNLMPFLFAILIIAILVSGSLWIMYNLNYYMMN